MCLLGQVARFRAADADALSAPQAHARRQAERARKRPSVAAQNEGQCAARGGAFALVRLRIAPSFLSAADGISSFVGHIHLVYLPHLRYYFRRYLSLVFPLIVASEIIRQNVLLLFLVIGADDIFVHNVRYKKLR